jgi:hypothetical protein
MMMKKKKKKKKNSNTIVSTFTLHFAIQKFTD